MFADDLSVFQEFDQSTPVSECKAQLLKCETRVHKWGKQNRVSFDAAKEHTAILHASQWHGETFKFLGCMVDPETRMHSAVEQVLSKIRPKITVILRTRGYYSTSNLIFQFKTHIWGLIEINMGGYFHAASSLLEKIDKAQNRFLRELELTPEYAFLEHAFAPPSLRRNIGVLGFLHKRVLGKCHPSTAKLLPFWTDEPEETRARGHSKKPYGPNVEIQFQRVMYALSAVSF